ncbi:MAG: asparagine synthetase B, partial [Oscillospiraceae bacterium]|nr:asparagine synthetase B [Oscillospiraceae bacterium]
MCSIMGFCGSGLSEEEFTAGLEKTASRGPDRIRILTFDHAMMGFERLTIMGLSESGMQPFVRG